MTYDHIPGITKENSQKIPCCSCYAIMDAVFSRGIRHTCHECGGVALRDSVADLAERRRARAAARRAERDGKSVSL